MSPQANKINCIKTKRNAKPKKQKIGAAGGLFLDKPCLRCSIKTSNFYALLRVTNWHN